MSAEHPQPDAQGEAVPAVPGEQGWAHQDVLTVEELEQHVAEADQLHRDLTARLDATVRD